MVVFTPAPPVLRDVIETHQEKVTVGCVAGFNNLPGLVEERYSDVTVAVSCDNREVKEAPVYFRLHKVILSGETHPVIGQLEVNLHC